MRGIKNEHLLLNWLDINSIVDEEDEKKNPIIYPSYFYNFSTYYAKFPLKIDTTEEKKVCLWYVQQKQKRRIDEHWNNTLEKQSSWFKND